jgi:hypothetical protein
VYLKFVFLTGYLNFPRFHIFGVKPLRDITLSKDYSTFRLYPSELEDVFARELKGEDLEAIKCRYNGYSWLGESVTTPLTSYCIYRRGNFTLLV